MTDDEIDGIIAKLSAEDVLRDLASYVGAGGHNAETVDPDVFYRKIVWGIDHLRDHIINTPETADFMAGVPLEAAHQRERWGTSHDAGKAPEDWFWLIGYLAGKALRAQNAGDVEKALHHTISTAAALANWHAAIAGVDTSMRPGIDLARLSGSDMSNG